MRLILSTRHPRNSTYSTEDGQILYKVDKPHKLGNGVATVRKAVHTVNGVWHGDSSLHPQARAKSPFSDFSDNELDKLPLDADRRRSTDSRDDAFKDSDSENGHGHNDDHGASRATPALEGHFAFYAQVEFHTFESSRFRYDGLDVSVKDYFHKDGWSWFGRNRVFKASDGKEYRWELRAGHLKMFTHDGTGSGTQVVKFREWHLHLGPLKGRPASLEIDPSCEPILDEIMMTFVYLQKLRKDRERSQRNAGHGGG